MTEQGESLGEILSADTTSVVETGADATTTVAPADTGQGRDEHGRFAPKADETQPPAIQQQITPAADTAPPEGFVPHGRFHAVNETAKAEKERADRLEAMLQQALQRQPQATPAPQTEQPKAKDIWEDPDAFIAQRLSPLEQSMQRTKEGVSKMLAESAHGKETVSAAYTALATAMQTNPQAVHDYRRIMANEHPYSELVSWHKRNETLNRIGNDPDTWLKAELAKMIADPTQAGELLKQIQQNTAGNTTIVPPSRSQAPATPPPSITRMPGSAATDDGSVPTLGDILKGR